MFVERERSAGWIVLCKHVKMKQNISDNVIYHTISSDIADPSSLRLYRRWLTIAVWYLKQHCSSFETFLKWNEEPLCQGYSCSRYNAPNQDHERKNHVFNVQCHCLCHPIAILAVVVHPLLFEPWDDASLLHLNDVMIEQFSVLRIFLQPNADVEICKFLNV